MQDEILSDELEKHEIFADYKKNYKKASIKKSQQNEWFKNSSFYISNIREKSKEYKNRLKDFLDSSEYKRLEQDEYRRQFISFAKKIEKDKLNTFIQIESNNILILQSPPDKVGNKNNKAKIVEFLGYDWSNRKGDEGIKYVVDQSSKIDDASVDSDEDDADITESINSIKYIETPLYNPKDDYDYTKYAFALKKHICEQCTKGFSFDFETSEKLNEFFAGDEHNLHYAKLSDMIDFSRTEFDRAIKLNEIKQRVEFKSKYPMINLGEYCFIKGGDTFKKEYQGNTNSQEIPFFKVSDMNSNGNEIYLSISNNYVAKDILKNKIKATIFKKGTIVFPKVGMAILTNKKRILKRDAAVDNNTMAVWVKNENELCFKYLYNYFVFKVDLSLIASTANPPSISASNLAKLKVPLPPLDVQKSIVSECEKIDDEYEKAKRSIEDAKNKINVILNSTKGKFIKLAEIITYGIYRISYKRIDPKSYVSTENLLQNCEGVTSYQGVPIVNKIIQYKKDDILISNIRPYLKKAWLADKDGGCSSDVLVFRISNKRNVIPKFLFFQLSQDKFFDYMMEGKKGVKMPRGDKAQITNYVFSLPSYDEQQRIISEIEKLESEIDSAKKIMSTVANRKKAVLKKYLCETE